ncbi:MAG: hypothetical protein ACREM8_15125, partial [Vulcanimicrobiaceae bacterium]
RNLEEKLPQKHQHAAHTAMTQIMHAEAEAEARRKLESLTKSYERSYPGSGREDLTASVLLR